ncbi:hypothetical protein ASPZODRAFT_154022 [Penicilliopsis zonata CBS 506.65]|uniref:GTPase-activating protein GYP5 n=1 Tax=Penicilliopsis zonata CBS 506.65 TaxID=1073090 RepID=A0A1L9SA70_9EURO|nr:hypothetical protein ASPZODRAFT_154022 [Penicilliopsis zonata CBS 506.65]OJJ44048.1 hypothetical protein ASPZODRAFT_154022 [Penicilliopsis zonata CBS 506.65]
MSSSVETREYEGDTFEDASELSSHIADSLPHSSSTRSLTDPTPSPGSTPVITEPPPLPSPTHDNEEREHEHEHEHEDGDEEEREEGSETASIDLPSEAEQTPRKAKLQKSPLLTAHRLSTTSLDDVNLAGNKDDEDLGSPGPDLDPSSPPPLPSRESSQFRGLSGNLPSVSFPPPPVKDLPTPPPPPPPPATRKLTGPFAWLTRSSTSANSMKSPPPQSAAFNDRRNTAASVSTISSSNVDLLSRLQDGEYGDKRPRRNSLKDQFKMLRMRDEGALSENDQASVVSGRTSIAHSAAGSPPSIPEETADGLAPAASSGLQSTVNPNLAPGTVSGISTSATDASAPVDWELWQQVVNHGPRALTGANSEEINAAIKRGIPQTIRGVIWQVLADSRNLELEEVYRELVARGTDKEKERQRQNGQANGTGFDKESLSSSRSSIRSDNSGSATNSNASAAVSPFNELDADKLVKEHAANEALRKKKAKEDAAALHKLEKTIRRDLGARTSYSKYFISQGSQEALFGLCKAYALYDDAVGYAQGMNFIVMPLLFNTDEAEAFTLLVKLMNKYGLREMFIQEMPGLHRSLYLFERLLEDLEPALYCHLRRRGVPPQLYATQWFLTLFAYRFPLQLVLRIYDLIFEEGLESTILKFAVAIMQRNAEALLGMKDMSPLTTFLKERIFDVYIDKQPSASSILESGFFGSSGAADKEVYRADIMVQDACSIPLTKEMIKSYTAEWEEKVRTEREREQELEGLKHTVGMQASKIRTLEERTEASDKEHVQLASELVRVKVENEELQDLTDALKMQVKELKIVVDKQPAEVEEKLRTEMDRIMQRNLEVQNENRAMEEQMAEMEKELVEAKMRWAEISENHEALKQKWSDLRKALD